MRKKLVITENSVAVKFAKEQAEERANYQLVVFVSSLVKYGFLVVFYVRFCIVFCILGYLLHINLI